MPLPSPKYITPSKQSLDDCSVGDQTESEPLVTFFCAAAFMFFLILLIDHGFFTHPLEAREQKFWI